MAKIVGNVTATPTLKPDWKQTDETKADYIKNKPFEGIDSELSSTSTNPVQNNVITSKMTSLQEQIDEIDARSYVSIDITAFNAGAYEIGREIKSVVLSWAINKKPTKLMLDGKEIESQSTGSYIANSQRVTYENNPMWSLRAEDVSGKMSSSDTATCKVSFYYAVYYGVGGLDSGFDSDFITQNLTSNIRGSNLSSFNVSSVDPKYIYYATPHLVSKFNVGGFDGGFEPYVLVNVTNQYNISKDYYVYRSTNKVSGDTTVKIT